MKTMLLAAGVAATVLCAGSALAANHRHHGMGGAVAPPKQPIPYAQLDSYLKASPAQRARKDWWSGQMAATGASANVSSSSSMTSSAASPAMSNDTSSGAASSSASSGMSSGGTDASANPPAVSSNAAGAADVTAPPSDQQSAAPNNLNDSAAKSKSKTMSTDKPH